MLSSCPQTRTPPSSTTAGGSRSAPLGAAAHKPVLHLLQGPVREDPAHLTKDEMMKSSLEKSLNEMEDHHSSSLATEPPRDLIWLAESERSQ